MTASMMNVLEQFLCKEGLNKLVLLSPEIRHFGGGLQAGELLAKGCCKCKKFT